MIKRWLLGFALLALVSGTASAQMTFIEGKDYQAVSPAVKTSQPDKVVVTEIFWYGCPHCFRFEPYAERLATDLPDGAIFEQVPSALNPRWTEHARAYYSFKLMDAMEQTHRQFFDAIHLKRQRLDNVDAIAEFVEEQGLDAKLFREYYYSFPVETQIRKNNQKESRYGHNGVPAVIVNGKYLITGSLAGSNDRMVQIIKYLVNRELAELN